MDDNVAVILAKFLEKLQQKKYEVLCNG